MSKKQTPTNDDGSKTFGLHPNDLQFLQDLQTTATNMRLHQATLLTMLARERYGYKETDNLMFQVNWKDKTVVISEREEDEQGTGDTKPETT